MTQTVLQTLQASMQIVPEGGTTMATNIVTFYLVMMNGSLLLLDSKTTSTLQKMTVT